LNNLHKKDHPTAVTAGRTTTGQSTTYFYNDQTNFTKNKLITCISKPEAIKYHD